MFTELLPMLERRVITITVAREGTDESGNTLLRCNVIPKLMSDKEDPALAEPLTVVATAEELDQELGKTLAEFVVIHSRTQNSLDSIKAKHEEAVRNAAKADDKPKAAPAQPAPATKPGAKKAETQAAGLLF